MTDPIPQTTANFTSNLRASSYVVYVPLPHEKDVLLVHGYSGAFDLVTKKVANYVKSLEKAPTAEPLFGRWTEEMQPEILHEQVSDDVVHRLQRRGYLTTMTVQEEERYFCELANTLHELELQGPPSFLFMPTYNCNLRCGYCFQNHMRTDIAFRPLLRLMDRSMVDRIFRALPQIERQHGISGARPVLRRMTFFGGEPLLQDSREIVQYIMTKAREDGRAEFSAITNGTQLDAYQDLLGPEGISFLQITLDGPPTEHDKRRVHVDGSGSFDVIARNITMALELGVNVDIRTNVDKKNIQNLPVLADEFFLRGWNNYPNFSAYAAVVVSTDTKLLMPNGMSVKKNTMNTWQLDDQLTQMRKEHAHLRIIRRPDDGLLSRISKVLSNSEDPLSKFRSIHCGAHGKMYLFDAFGDIYACWEKTGDPVLRIGYISEDSTVFSNSLSREWRSRTVASNPVCRRCRFAFYCGGGCAANAIQQNGEFFSNYCDAFATRFRAIAAEAYQHYITEHPSETPERMLELAC